VLMMMVWSPLPALIAGVLHHEGIGFYHVGRDLVVVHSGREITRVLAVRQPVFLKAVGAVILVEDRPQRIAGLVAEDIIVNAPALQIPVAVLFIGQLDLALMAVIIAGDAAEGAEPC